MIIGNRGILEYPDLDAGAIAMDAKQDAAQTTRGSRTNTTGMPLGCLPATSELHVEFGPGIRTRPTPHYGLLRT